MIKLWQVRDRRELLSDKRYNSTVTGELLEVFSLRLQTDQDDSLMTSVNSILVVLVSAIKKTNGVRIRKKNVTLLLFIHDMILNINNCYESISY